MICSFNWHFKFIFISDLFMWCYCSSNLINSLTLHLMRLFKCMWPALSLNSLYLTEHSVDYLSLQHWFFTICMLFATFSRLISNKYISILHNWLWQDNNLAVTCLCKQSPSLCALTEGISHTSDLWCGATDTWSHDQAVVTPWFNAWSYWPTSTVNIACLLTALSA